MTGVLLHHAFASAAQRVPGKVALVCDADRWTYAQLRARVHRLARALGDDGVAPGDRVLLFLETGAEYAVAVHAVLAAGAVFVPVSPMIKSEKLAFLLADTRATALLTHARLAGVWGAAIGQAPHLLSVRAAGKPDAAPAVNLMRSWPDEDGPVPALPEAARTDQDLAALIYTSGSTGIAKGVMLSHLNMTSAWASVQAYLGLRESDVIGLALSPVYSYGLYYLLMGLGLGATVVLERRSAFPIKVAETIERERVSVLPGVPTLFAALLEVPRLRDYDFGALRLLTNAAAALPQLHLQRLREALPHAQLYSMYGLTECKRASYLAPQLLDERRGSVGRGMPNQEHWLIDDEGRRLPDGATGELVVRGRHVMRGYWERPAETAERLRPGPIAGESVLHTGDLFRSDADGYLYFVARKDDIIKTRGEKVAPREVEDAIHQLDVVSGCAVVGVPDALLGRAIKAYVMLRPGASSSARDIIRHCLARLENHMVPKFVEIVSELPRTESGKIRHASLR